MESAQNLKKRLKTVNNIKQITKAMELVAATKMRKSQQIALDSRPYALAVLDLLAGISRLDNIETPVILQKRAVKKTLFAVLCSDKGLVGSFNSALLRLVEKYFKDNSLNFRNPNFSFVSIGEKAHNFLLKKGANVLQKFTRVGDFITVEQTRPIADFLVKGYLQNDFDKAIIFSTNFRNAFSQIPLQQELLPVDFENIRKVVSETVPTSGKFAEMIKEQNMEFCGEKISDYLIEPTASKVLESLVKHLLSMQIYHLILEANASEHAAKRLAMKNASDNALDLSNGLTLIFNKTRQAKITQELVEIVSGS